MAAVVTLFLCSGGRLEICNSNKAELQMHLEKILACHFVLVRVVLRHSKEYVMASEKKSYHFGYSHHPSKSFTIT